MKSTIFNKIIFTVMSFFFIVNSSYAGNPLFGISPHFIRDVIYVAAENTFHHHDYRLEYGVTSYTDVPIRFGFPFISDRVQALGSCLVSSVGPRGTCSLVLSVSLDGLKAGDQLKIRPTLCNGDSKLQCYQSPKSVTLIIK